MNELLRTRAFLMDVAGRTSLAPLMATSAGEARVADLIWSQREHRWRRHGRATFGGDHLLLIRVQAPTRAGVVRAVQSHRGRVWREDAARPGRSGQCRGGLLPVARGGVAEAAEQGHARPSALRDYARQQRQPGLGESSTSSTDLPGRDARSATRVLAVGCPSGTGGLQQFASGADPGAARRDGRRAGPRVRLPGPR